MVLFNLVRRGYLQNTEYADGKLQRCIDAPNLSSLSEIERSLFDLFDRPRSLDDVSKIRQKEPWAPYLTRVTQERLLIPRALKTKLVLSCSVLIAGLGAYKLAIALSKGKQNVMFLIVMGLLSIWVLFRMSSGYRLSDRGRDYLTRLQKTFGTFKDQAPADPTDPSYAVLVALFGAGVLAGTAFAELVPSLRAAGSAGGDSSSFDSLDSEDSSSSTDSGSGCGGCGGD